MKNLDKNSSVNLLKQDGNFRWLSCNGTKFKQELQSWESKDQMMWITFAGNDFQNKWFKDKIIRETLNKC